MKRDYLSAREVVGDEKATWWSGRSRPGRITRWSTGGEDFGPGSRLRPRTVERRRDDVLDRGSRCDDRRARRRRPNALAERRRDRALGGARCRRGRDAVLLREVVRAARAGTHARWSVGTRGPRARCSPGTKAGGPPGRHGRCSRPGGRVHRVTLRRGRRAHHDRGVSIQANMMERPTVWPAMAEAYRAARGELADRLLAALRAAEAEGGDVRGRQSAATAGRPCIRAGLGDALRPARRGRSRTPRRARATVAPGASLRGVRPHRGTGDGGRLQTAADAMTTAHELAPDDDQITLWTSLFYAGAGRNPTKRRPCSPRPAESNHARASTSAASSPPARCRPRWVPYSTC